MPGPRPTTGSTTPEVRLYEWEQRYATAEYVGLLATASEVRLLSEERREPFLAAVAEVIDAHGEPLSIPMRTRAVPRSSRVTV